MKIRYIEIKIEPFLGGYKRITVECRVNEEIFQWDYAFVDDAFEDLFGHLMGMAEDSIRESIEKYKKK